MLRTARVRVLVTVLALAGSSLALTGTEPPPVDTEVLYIAAGCPADATGSCTSVRWLGTEAGDATSNYRNSTTPVDEVRYRADGSLNWRDYWSDGTVGEYVLTGEAIGAVVTLSSNGPGIQTTVHLRLTATVDGETVVFEPDPQTVDLAPASRTQVPFTIAVDEHASAVLEDPLVELAIHGLNVQAGYIDQQGGSTLTIPYVVPAEDPAAS